MLRSAFIGALLFVSVVAAGFLFFADYASAADGKICVKGECLDGLDKLPVHGNFGYTFKRFRPSPACDDGNIGPYCKPESDFKEGLGNSDFGDTRYLKGYCDTSTDSDGKNCATEYEERVQGTSGLCIKGRCFNINEPSVDFQVNGKKYNFEIQSGESVNISVRPKNVRELILAGITSDNKSSLDYKDSDSLSVANVEKNLDQYQTTTYSVIAKGGPNNSAVVDVRSIIVSIMDITKSESRVKALARGLDKGVEKYNNNWGARLACGTFGFVAGAYFGGEVGLAAGAAVGTVLTPVPVIGTVVGGIGGAVAGLLAAGFSLTSLADSMCGLMTGVAEAINSINAVQGAWDWNNEMKEAGIFGANATKGFTLGMMLGALRGIVSSIVGNVGTCIGDALFSLGLLVFNYILDKADIDQPTKNFIKDSFFPQEHNYAFDFAFLAGSTTMQYITKFVGDKGLSAVPFGLGEVYKGARDLIHSIGSLPQCPSVINVTPISSGGDGDDDSDGDSVVEPTGDSQKPDPLLGKHRPGKVNVETGKATNIKNPNVYYSDNTLRQASNASQIAINVARWNNYQRAVGSDQIIEAIRGLPSTVLEDLSKIYETYSGDMSHAKTSDLENILQTLNAWGVLKTIPIK